jgi:hypothetical protein
MLGIDRSPQAPADHAAPAAAQRRRWWLVALPLAGVLLVAAGVAVALTRDRAPATEVVVGDERLVTAEASIVDAHNSPALARSPSDPSLLVVADKVDRPRFTAGLHLSRDGGATWSPLTFPTPAGQDRPYAPDLAWTTDGVLHLSFVTLAGTGNSPGAVWLTSSTDAGTTWETPRQVLGAYAFQVRLAADPAGQRLFLTWLQADRESTSGLLSFSKTGLPVMAMRSDDAGRTFGEPVRVSPADRLRVGAAVPRVLPGGGLAVLYFDYKDDRLDFENLEGGVYEGTFALVLARSDAAFDGFSETLVDDGIVPTERFLVYLPDFPGLAVGRNGELYAAWADGRSGDRDVLLRRSDDGGRSWAASTRVHPASDADQYLPAVSVAPNGRVDVAYLDRRDDADDNVLTAVSYAVSADGGETWSTLTLSQRLFSSEVGPGSEVDQADQGTQLDIVSGADGAAAVWTDARAGTVDTGKLDVYFAPVRIGTRDP